MALFGPPILIISIGIPWQYLSSLATRYARTVGHVEITDVALRVTVNDWRDIIGRIYTKIFNIHLDEDLPNPVKIRLSTYHREEFDLLEKKRALGIITDDEYILMSRSEMGLHVVDKLDELKKRVQARDMAKQDNEALLKKKQKKEAPPSPHLEEDEKKSS